MEMVVRRGKKRGTYVGLLLHNLKRCTARNLSRAGLPEVVGVQVTPYESNSMSRRYRITSESELSEAQEKMQRYLEGQTTNSKVATIDEAVSTV